MTVNLAGYNAEEHKPMEQFDAIPAGDYRAIATNSEMKATKQGDGMYLQIEWELLDEPYRGRKLWSRLNLENKNETAVKIAQQELSSICRAVGILRPKDSGELHNKPVMLKVGVELRKDTGEQSNRIKNYAPVAPVSAPTTSAAPPKAAAAGGKPPWRQ